MQKDTDVMSVAEVCARLGISRATVYRTPFLRHHAIQVAGRTGWLVRDIDRYLTECQRGIRRAGRRVAVRRKAKAA